MGEFLDNQSLKEKLKSRGYILEIGGKSPETLLVELGQNSIAVHPYAGGMIESSDFKVLPHTTTVQVVRVTYTDLGFPITHYPSEVPTNAQLLKRAKSLGLTKLPAEAGPQARLQDKNQKPGDSYEIVMEPILARDSTPSVFRVAREGDRLKLDIHDARPNERQWSDGPVYYLFRLDK